MQRSIGEASDLGKTGRMKMGGGEREIDNL